MYGKLFILCLLTSKRVDSAACKLVRQPALFNQEHSSLYLAALGAKDEVSARVQCLRLQFWELMAL